MGKDEDGGPVSHQGKGRVKEGGTRLKEGGRNQNNKN